MMRKKNMAYRIIIVFILIMFSLTGCSNAKKDSSANVVNNSADVLALSEENMMQTIEEIANVPHPIDSEENQEVQEYIISRLNTERYSIEKQIFYYTDKKNEAALHNRSNIQEYLNLAFTGNTADQNGTNIIARKNNSSSGKKILLTAHYDSCADAPGANDNGSGVAILLELSRILAEEKLPFDVEFVFFSGEEKFFLGSRYYVSQLKDMDVISGVINIDTVAEKSDEEYWILVGEGTEYTDEAGMINYTPTENAMAQLFADDKTYQLKCMFSSDHYPFSLVQIPAISITQDLSEEISANSADDTIDKIDSSRMLHVAESVREKITNLVPSP